MKRIAFLGCENSHSATFLNFIKNDEKFADVEVVGVYSHDRTAADNLGAKYGVPVLDDYADAVGKVDGVIVTVNLNIVFTGSQTIQACGVRIFGGTGISNHLAVCIKDLKIKVAEF